MRVPTISVPTIVANTTKKSNYFEIVYHNQIEKKTTSWLYPQSIEVNAIKNVHPLEYVCKYIHSFIYILI